MKSLSKDRGFFYRSGASPYQRSGVSDIMGVYYGFIIAIEVKTPEAMKRKDRGCTKNQLLFQQLVAANGGFATVVCSVDQVREFMRLVTERIETICSLHYLEGLR